MASHMLDEVEKVCTHVAILKTGNLITAGHVDEVLVNEDIVEVSARDMQQLEAVLTVMGGFKSLKKAPAGIQLLYPTGTANLEGINQYCFNNGLVLSHLQLKKKSLETKFLELTNN
jgi:ABC-2 type transport system ATP-binding protein